MGKKIDAEELYHRMYEEAFEKDSDLQKWDSGCWIRFKLFENVLKDMPEIEAEEKTGHWIPVSERLPEDFETYLITLEDGVVCQCGFNPDFWDEDNNRMGAFTYNHQYFDTATLGMIDEEEEAVNAIAWMPFEPYKAESEE